MANIIKPRETWFIFNASSQTVSISDIPSIPTFKPGQRINVLDYSDYETLNNSIILRNYLKNNVLKSEDYLHTHDDKADIDHVISSHYDTDATGVQLNILTKGSLSDADYLHTHPSFVLNANLENQVVEIMEKFQEDPEQMDTSVFVLREGSINQLSDITSTGNLIENAVSKSHNELHIVQSHIDTTATGSQLNTLTGGTSSNADSLHYHKLIAIKDVSATYTEVNRTLYGIGVSATAFNLTSLTDGSNADALHTHTGVSSGYWTRNIDTSTLTTVVDNDNVDIQSGNLYFGNDASIYSSNGDLFIEGINPSVATCLKISNLCVDIQDNILYFGENQEGSIYYLDEYLYINVNNPSAGEAVIFNSFPQTPEEDPVSDYEVANKQYVDNSVAVENLWDRTGSTLSPVNANDNVDIGSGNYITTGNIIIDSNNYGIIFGIDAIMNIYYNDSDLVIENMNPSVGDGGLRLNLNQADTGFLIDQSTTPYENLTDNYTLYIDKLHSAPIPVFNSFYRSYNIYNKLLDNTKVTTEKGAGGCAWATYLHNYGLYNWLTYTGEHTVSGATRETMYGVYNNISRVGTPSSSQVYSYGIYTDITLSVDSSQTHLSYGEIILINTNGATTTKKNYGVYIDIDNDNVGASTNTGLYLNIDDDAVTNRAIDIVSTGSNNTTWAIYSASTGDSCFAGSTKFGAASAPAYIVDIVGDVNIEGTEAWHGDWNFTEHVFYARFYQSSSSSNLMAFDKARGIRVSQLAVDAQDYLGRIWFRGYGNSDYQEGAGIEGVAAEDFTDSSSPGYLVFSTTPSGSTTLLERVRIDENGNIIIWGDNKKLYFGKNRDSSIYYDSENLIISLDNPSVGGIVNIQDDLQVDGYIQVGSGSLLIDERSISSNSEDITINNSLTIGREGKVDFGDSSFITKGSVVINSTDSEAGIIFGADNEMIIRHDGSNLIVENTNPSVGNSGLVFNLDQADTGFLIDQATTPYESLTTSYTLYVDKIHVFPKPLGNYHNYYAYNAYFKMLDNTSVMDAEGAGGCGWLGTLHNYGIYNWIEPQGEHTLAGATITENNYGIYNNVVRSGDPNSTTTKNYGIYNNMDINIDSGTHTTYGEYIVINSVGAGDNKFNYGIYIDIDNDANGSTTNTGIYLLVDNDADTNKCIDISNQGSGTGDWAIYSASTSDSCFVGPVKFGGATAPDANADIDVVGDVYIGGDVGIGDTDPDTELEINGKITFQQVAAPAGNPAADKAVMYLDAADGSLKVKFEDGDVVTIATY